MSPKQEQKLIFLQLSASEVLTNESSNTPEEVDLVIRSIPIATVSSSPEEPEPLTQSKDISNVANEIIINESMGEEDLYRQQLDAQEDQSCFWNRINEVTQSDESADAFGPEDSENMASSCRVAQVVDNSKLEPFSANVMCSSFSRGPGLNWLPPRHNIYINTAKRRYRCPNVLPSELSLHLAKSLI